MATKKAASKTRPTGPVKPMMPEDDIIIIEDAGGTQHFCDSNVGILLKTLMSQSTWSSYVRREGGRQLAMFKTGKNHSEPLGILGQFHGISVRKNSVDQPGVPSAWTWIKITTHTASITVSQSAGVLKIITSANWHDNSGGSFTVFASQLASKIQTIAFNNGKVFQFAAGETAQLTIKRP
jgi:hypothetical protein